MTATGAKKRIYKPRTGESAMRGKRFSQVAPLTKNRNYTNNARFLIVGEIACLEQLLAFCQMRNVRIS
jgi:hypothetical protein